MSTSLPFLTLEDFNLHWYNAGMQKIKLAPATICVGLVILMLLSACAQGVPIQDRTPTGTLEGTLRPYPTHTGTATPLPTGYASPTSSPTLTLTPTPVFYDVQEGDDMYSIAWRYNLSPAEIMTANPTVNPRAMGIGTTLLIPITPAPEGTSTPSVADSPTPTPLYSVLREPDCYLEALGGLWCFILIENDEEGALENVSALVTLEAGGETREKVAILPLNLLPGGESLPLIAYFEPQVPEDYTVSVQVDFLLPVMPDDERYLKVEIEDPSINFREDDQVAQISGELVLAEGQPDTRYVWVNATAFDADGHVVGVRRWEYDNSLSTGEWIPFEIFLYSMGGPIDRVDLLVEAQPILESSQE